MSLKLTTHEKGDVVLVEATGKLTLGEGTSSLRNRVRELVDGGSKRILLNMAGVTWIDSSGLGELVAAYTTVTNAGGEMKLLYLAKHAHDLMEITKLCSVFEIFENQDSAIRSFSVPEPTELQLRWARFMRRVMRRSWRERWRESPNADWDDDEKPLPSVNALHASRTTG